jgi:hypothetical protein
MAVDKEEIVVLIEGIDITIKIYSREIEDLKPRSLKFSLDWLNDRMDSPKDLDPNSYFNLYLGEIMEFYFYEDTEGDPVISTIEAKRSYYFDI